MKNFIHEGKTLMFIAPSGGVTSGTPVVIGGIFVVPTVSAAEAATFAGEVKGVYALTKKASETWAAGDAVYFDNGVAQSFTKTPAADLIPCGFAAAPAASSDTTADVLIVSQPHPLLPVSALSAIAGTYADLAAARTSVNAFRGEVLAILQKAGLVAST